MGAAAPGAFAEMSHLLHGFTDPKYLDVLIAKTETQIREAKTADDRQRFEAYLDILKGWKLKMDGTQETCGEVENSANTVFGT